MAASNVTAAELVMRCFNARTTAHILHLGTRSYAAHMALGDFYDGIAGRADSFAEAYQGIYGLLTFNNASVGCYDPGKDYRDGQAMLVELRAWVCARRKDIGSPTDTELQNIIDEIVSLIDSTVYKLRFLR